MSEGLNDSGEPRGDRRVPAYKPGGDEHRARLILAALQVIRREAARTKDGFTADYLISRAERLESCLTTGAGKDDLLSASNIVSKLAEAIDSLTKYDVPADQLYKAAVQDLRGELEAASEGRSDYW